MTRKEAIAELKSMKTTHNSLDMQGINSDVPMDEESIEALDMAISALSADEISEDGTLTVHVKDGSKVKRVFVKGDNIFGGLYYPDLAEGEYIKKETLLKYCTYVELANGNKGWVLEKGYIEDLPAVSFPDREKVGTCSKCGKWGKLIGIQGEKFKLWVCSNCGADMREGN